MKTAVIILAIITLLSVAAGVVFATKSQTASGEADKLESQLNAAEKELIYYKNTDLGKEVQFLNLKLANAERDLVASKKEVNELTTRALAAEAKLAKIAPFLNAMTPIHEMFFGDGPSSSGVAKIDSKIAALQDTDITAKWNLAKQGIDVIAKSWGGPSIGETLSLIIVRIRALLP